MFLHTNSELSEKEIRKVIPFTIEPPIIKYLATNLPNKMKDLYTENYKTLVKNFKRQTQRQFMFMYWKT